MKNLFVWEIKKNVKKSALIGIGVTLLVMLILIAIVYNLLMDLLKEVQSGLENGELGEITDELGENIDIDYVFGTQDLPADGKVTKEQLIQYRERLKLEVAEYEKLYKEKKSQTYEPLFEARSRLKAVEYAIDNGYYEKEVRILGVNYSTGDLNAEGFLSMYGSIVVLVIAVYGVVYAANTYTNEYKTGTIKIIMTRPITKNAMTCGKLLAMYATLAVMYLLPVFISFIYGVIAFGSDANAEFIYAFNASGAGVTTLGAYMFGVVFMQLIRILTVATFAFALSTITRNSTVGLIAGLIVTLGLGSFFSSLGVSAFMLSNAFGLMTFFGGEPGVYLGNFWISFAVIIFWLAASLAAVFVVTDKRDIY